MQTDFKEMSQSTKADWEIIGSEAMQQMQGLPDRVLAHLRLLEGECGGCLSCATCHVFVEPQWLAKTGEVDDIEDTMLEMTDVEREDNSRLSCQIIASAELDGLVLHVPEPE